MISPEPLPRPGSSATELNRGLMVLLALSAFAAAGAMHYQSPMLGAIGIEFGADAAAVGWVATLSFGGYLAGLIFIVPLGDRLDKRTLILIQFAGVIVSTLAMAAAPSLAAAAVASFVIGACVCLTQSIVALVVELARPETRGRVVGTVMSALFAGILFSRLAGGFIASLLGWRWAYVLSAVLLIVLAAALAAQLPSSPPKTRLSYLSLLRSLARLLRTHRELRRASAIQFLLGICYGGFWATIAPMLLLLHRLGPTEAGLMGIPGAAGILVARPAGRWTDRRGAAPVVTIGACVVLVAFITLEFAAWSIAFIVAGAILLDCGVRATMVANQTLVTGVDPEARNRLNTVFAGHMWAGNSAGAFLASTALALGGWTAACTIGVIAASAALLLPLPRPRAN